MAEKRAIPTVAPNSSLLETMAAIDEGACEIALVVQRDLQLLGTVTDGDIRRAILAGASLDSSVSVIMNRRFVSVSEESRRDEVIDIMQARSIGQVPIVDTNGRLVGLHLLREILGCALRPNWVVIMAGGRGQRLRPLTDVIPKPMVKVAGRPILERIVLHLVGQGFREFFLAINYKGALIEEHFGDGSAHGCRINYLREHKPLGTGGALSLLPGTPEHPMLVLNGDLVTQFRAGDMLDFHELGGFPITIAYHVYQHSIPYGVLQLDGKHVAQIQEKPTETWPVNAGIYAIAPSLLHRIPADTHFPLPSIVDDCLSKGSPVGAFGLEGDWIDVGHHSELRRARGEDRSWT